jgi:predicted alpha/beta hydrolase family esterase
MGGVEGVWDEEAKEELKRVLGVYGSSDSVTVHRKQRWTKDEAPKLVKQVGWKQPKQTWIAFSTYLLSLEMYRS